MATAIDTRQRGSRVLDGLAVADRKLYASLPEEVDYVPHPDFHLRRTEHDLFGPDAEEIRIVGWRQMSADCEDLPPRLQPRPRLTQSQERALFTRLNYARYRLAGLVAKRTRPSAARVQEILLWFRRVLECRAALTSANMALVMAMGQRAGINTVEFGDLVSEGNMALLRSIDKFDVTRGFKFSTYACRAILKSFSRLAARAGVYRQRFPVEYDPDMDRSDEVDRRHSDQHALAVTDLRHVLGSNAGGLTEVERTVVDARFALDGADRARTLEQVGRLVGLSKERVRQVQNSALGKLRGAMEKVAGQGITVLMAAQAPTAAVFVAS